MKRILGFILAVALIAPAAQAQTPVTAGKVRTVCVTPTISDTAYATADVIGGKQTIANAMRSGIFTGVMQNIMVLDIGAEAKSIEICIFNQDPSASTITNDAAVDFADADLSKIAGCTTVSDFSAFADNGIGQAKNLGLAIDTSGGTSLYAVAIDRSTGATYDSTAALTFCYTIMQD